MMYHERHRTPNNVPELDVKHTIMMQNTQKESIFSLIEIISHLKGGVIYKIRGYYAQNTPNYVPARTSSTSHGICTIILQQRCYKTQ